MMSLSGVVLMLFACLAITSCAPQSLLSPGAKPISLLDGTGLTEVPSFGSSSPALSPGPAVRAPPLNLAPFPSIPAPPSRPFYSGSAGSPQAAAGFSESAATNVRGISGGLKGVGVRVYQSPNGRFTSGAGFSSNLKGSNAVGGFIRYYLD